jgi:hypothetical protein
MEQRSREKGKKPVFFDMFGRFSSDFYRFFMDFDYIGLVVIKIGGF